MQLYPTIGQHFLFSFNLKARLYKKKTFFLRNNKRFRKSCFSLFFVTYLLFLLFFDYSRLKKSGLCVAGAGPRVYRGCRLAVSLSFLSADKPACILIIPVNGILSFLPAAKHEGILSIPAGFAARLSQDYLLKRPVYYVFYPASDNRLVGSRGRRGSLLYPVIYISYYPSELYFF